MVNDLYRKMGPFFLKKNLVQVAAQFFISAIIGVIYAFMIIDETIGGYIIEILPSKGGPNLHQYLPIVITVLIYSCFIQRKERIFLEKISFSCLNILIAILSFISALIVIMMVQFPMM
ncbi:hypothetical protein [Paenibacillus pabuli]|uniref:hypothetical protein n=1 Tax=Paenibacillus pabuli TaxID=1472 RepID=UPI000782F6B6|nr:hypothetical protein [Paenibacillus pabuli]MEC0124596.1 hypothetical protein [Paenibacillus pabuli]